MKSKQNLKRTTLANSQKSLLEELTQEKIFLKNTFKSNQKAIAELQDQARQNALVYLKRNKLGEKLNLFEENNLFICLVELQKILGLKKVPRRIECYDISHLSGKFVYGSMVVFLDGRPAKKFYRLFKTKEQNNDFANHKEVLERRISRFLKTKGEGRDFDAWTMPDLVIVDGGKGQLTYDLEVINLFKEYFKEKNIPFETELCALAKSEEEIFTPDFDEKEFKSRNPNFKLGSNGGILLSGQTKFLVQRIRDEAHRFAITNNQKARVKTAVESELDKIDGVGQKTKSKILETFGSVKNFVKTLDENEKLAVELLGESKVETIKKYFGM